jgi:hypothetical protein
MMKAVFLIVMLSVMAPQMRLNVKHPLYKVVFYIGIAYSTPINKNAMNNTMSCTCLDSLGLG